MTKKQKVKIKSKVELEEDPSIKQLSRYKRQREVEELYLNGYPASEIHTHLVKKYPVKAGTIRNDIVSIRKRWKGDLIPEQIKDAREQYLGSLYSVRRKALAGWREDEKVRGRDFKLVHELDKEIARINGVSLKSDTKNLAITVEKAKEYLDSVMGVVFTHIVDEEIREAIITDLALIDEQP